MRRNLLYHVYASAENDVWRWNLDFLKQHLHYFDRAIVGVATDSRSIPAAKISQYLADYPDIEFVLARNEPGQGELTTMPTMLEMVSSLREDESTFYAHAKGVSHHGRKLQAVQSWVSAMYELNFPAGRIDRLLRNYSCAGAFQRGGIDDIGPIGNEHGWHYSGNFWWVKHSALFALDWRPKLKGKRHAAENFLGELFPIEQAVCTGMCGPYPLYSARDWSKPHGSIYRALRNPQGERNGTD